MKKNARTISGVTPVAVMARPMKCPGACVYCPTFAMAPQSYTPESPAVIRALSCDFDTTKQIQMRINVLRDMGHPVDKIELIVMGGTFLASPVEYQYRFIKDCYDALNGTVSASLEEAKDINRTAGHRCTGLCIETRPDWCGPAEIQRMLEFGTTRVELGVQTLDDEVYRRVRRGHRVADVIRATARLKQSGFKVHYHWMPGLPGLTPERDLALSRRLFEDPDFRPDGLKLYPTMVVQDTELENWYRRGEYRPYDDETMINLLVDIKSIVPEYVRISRVLRDIPSKFIVAGCRDSIRSLVKQRLQQRAIECRCIRCREYGHRRRQGREIGPPELRRLDYEASGGKEIFLSFTDTANTLFGLLRLRVQSQPVPGISLSQPLTPVIRELHVYGQEVPLSEQRDEAVQHRGLGKALIKEAERIAFTEFGARQIAVLSGVGAQEYYREFGYTPVSCYMVKNLAAVR